MTANYHKELEKIISGLTYKPKLLLHACCGPCSSYTLEYLAEHFEITILYYNPNIYPEEEYFRRLNELKDLLKKFPPALKNKVQFIELKYDPKEFYEAIKIKENPELADEEEKGERCRRCYEFRLKKALEYAEQNQFEYFCTTLSISPFKDAEKINTIGREIETEKTKWLVSDFKKNGGFQRSLQISKEYNLYRQQYCGCVYSVRTAVAD